MDAELECVVFPKSYASGISTVVPNETVVVSGRLNHNQMGLNPATN